MRKTYASVTVDLGSIAVDVLVEYLIARGYAVATAPKTPFARVEGSSSDLGKFSTASLLCELERRGEPKAITLASATENQILSALRERDEYWNEPIPVDRRLLDEAAARFARRDFSNALHDLERALPSDFAGLAQLALENRP